jgi:hypothetical protein
LPLLPHVGGFFGWIWLDLAGFGWIWLDLVGFGWIWLDLVGFDLISFPQRGGIFVASEPTKTKAP